MYPEVPAEPVPLQEVKYDVLPQQPGEPAVGQYTTVNITTEPPRDHIIWSFISFFYSNILCLGLVALIYSIKARDRKVVGDMAGARRYGSTARDLNIAATVLFVLLIIIGIILIFFNPLVSGYMFGLLARRLI